ncbi:MAG: tetratricopeptide repeat protein [Polyangiales bacterium]
MDGPIFRGRAVALGALHDAFAQGERVVTVLGAAGMGKTALARRFAFGSPQQFASALGEGTPVAWCDCALAHTEESLLHAIAAGLGAPTGPSPYAASVPPLERVADALSLRGSALLVLDHLAAPAAARAAVNHLHARCRELRVLATARAAAGFDAEVTVPLEGVTAAEAADLWAAFEGPRGPSALVESVAARLGGNPLALELFARLDLREALDRRAEALGARPGAPALPLDELLSRVWGSLRPREQAALAELSVFADSFSLDAAEAVLSAAVGSQTALPILLADFRMRGLVRILEDLSSHQVRFTLDPAVRAFVAREFARSPDRRAALTRHAEHYLQRAEALLADHALRGSQAAADRLSVERANLDAVFERAGECFDPAAALGARLRVALCQLPDAARHGLLGPRLAAVDAALELAGAGPSSFVLAGAWAARAWRLSREGRADAALAALDRALALGRKEYNPHALHAVALVKESAGALVEALDAARRANDAFDREQRQREGAGAMVTMARLLQRAGAVDEAAGLFARAAARARENGDDRAEADARLGRGRLELARGNAADARAELEEAARCQERAHRHDRVAEALASLARLAHDQGRTDDALDAFQQAVARAIQLGDRAFVAALEAELGAVLHELGSLVEARALLDRALEVVAPRDPRRGAFVRAHLAATLASCGELDAAEALIASSCAALSEPGDALGPVARALRVFVILCRARELPMPEARQVAREARHELAALRSLPVELDSAELRIALRLLSGFDGDELLRPSEERARPKALVASRMGLWFVPPDAAEVSLRTRSTLSVLLRRLGEERLARPGVSLSPESLIADMWPGEKIIPKAARNRLHVAVRTLRTMGLGTVLRSSPEGYHLDPTVPFQFVGEAPSIPPV